MSEYRDDEFPWTFYFNGIALPKWGACWGMADICSFIDLSWEVTNSSLSRPIKGTRAWNLSSALPISKADFYVAKVNDSSKLKTTAMSTSVSEPPAGVGAPLDQNSSNNELLAFNKIIAAINSIPPESQMRLMKSVLTFLGLADPIAHKSIMPKEAGSPTEGPKPSNTFSEDRTPSAKEFMLQKRPTTDTERIACLAYYLTHFRGTSFFKTLDLSKLNTEAAQIKLSNPTVAMDSATGAGLLVPAGKGNKQISALGELYVQALPDREAARAAIAHARPRRKGKRTGGRSDAEASEDQTNTQ